MADASGKSRLSPPLMHAFRAAHAAKDARKQVDLRDEAGERLITGRRSARAAVTEAVLRREVAADLENLMNTINLDAAVDLGNSTVLRRSILNFGLPEVSRHSVDSNSAQGIRDELLEALKSFEPRLIPGSLKVRREGREDDEKQRVRFFVTAELSCEPVAVPVEFVADLEVGSGKVQIARL